MRLTRPTISAMASGLRSEGRMGECIDQSADTRHVRRHSTCQSRIRVGASLPPFLLSTTVAHSSGGADVRDLTRVLGLEGDAHREYPLAIVDSVGTVHH